MNYDLISKISISFFFTILVVASAWRWQSKAQERAVKRVAKDQAYSDFRLGASGVFLKLEGYAPQNDWERKGVEWAESYQKELPPMAGIENPVDRAFEAAYGA